MTTRIQTAPGLHGCCDAAGRMLMMAKVPMPLERLVGVALARGEGTREEIAQRVQDMLACGLLIEVDDERGA